MRPHYTPQELDSECEQIICTFLRARNGAVEFPVSTDDLTALLEERVEDLDLFADLSEFGPGVEGVTIFRPGGKPSVKISQDLSGNANRENRLRTTLTHEFGHVHFHNYLFDPEFSSAYASGPRPTFSNNQRPMKQVCKRDTMLETTESDWMEWQAGHVCGAILMPATQARSLLKKSPRGDASEAAPAVSSVEAMELIEAIRGHFQVSGEAAKIRLLRLNILK